MLCFGSKFFKRISLPPGQLCPYPHQLYLYAINFLWNFVKFFSIMLFLFILTSLVLSFEIFGAYANFNFKKYQKEILLVV